MLTTEQPWPRRSMAETVLRRRHRPTVEFESKRRSAASGPDPYSECTINDTEGLEMNMRNDHETRALATVSDPRWAAVVARDARADGSFFYSVRTTGVYCRPSCASRRAR